MKTTVELPDALFRRAKAAAAQQGATLKDFFTEAVEARLQRPAGAPPAWKSAFGGLKDLRRENRRIERSISAAFEKIDREEWR